MTQISSVNPVQDIFFLVGAAATLPPCIPGDPFGGAWNRVLRKVVRKSWQTLITCPERDIFGEDDGFWCEGLFFARDDL